MLLLWLSEVSVQIKTMFSGNTALIIGTFAVVMSATTINIAIVPMMRELAVGHQAAQLFSSLFLGATVLAAPLSAGLARRWGGRRLFMALLVGYVLVSCAGLITESFQSLLLVRVLQGLCAGLIQPLAMFLILEAASASRLGRAISAYGLGVVLAPALGPTLAGWCVDYLGWRSSFVLGVPPAMLALFLAWRFLPAASDADSGHKASFDWAGFTILNLLIGLLVFWPVLIGHELISGWLIAITGGVLIRLLLRAERSATPSLMPMSLFNRPGFRAVAFITMAYGAGMYGSIFLIPVYMQGALMMSAITTGNVLLLGGAGLAVSTFVGGALVDRLSARDVVTAALACFSVSCLVLAVAHDLGWIALAVVLGRVGLGLMIPGLYAGMAQALGPESLRDGTGTITLLRQASGAMGVSMIGVLSAAAATAEIAVWLGLATAYDPGAAPALIFVGLALIFLVAMGMARKM